MFGNSYGRSSSSSAGAIPVLVFLALIGTIALTIILYRKYASSPNEKLDLSSESSRKSFFSFDTLLIERIIKAIYILAAVAIVLFPVAAVLGLLFVRPGAAIGLLLTSIPMVAIGEVFIRMLCESLMLNVIVARNTSDIKRALGSNEVADEDGISSPTAPPMTSKVCQHCGTPNNVASKFCLKCGQPFE